MKSKKDLRQKDSKDKYIAKACVITGVIMFGGMSCIIIKQQLDIDKLSIMINKNKTDINLLKEVLHGNVIHSLRESYKRKLRYTEGRLMAGITKNTISTKDIKLREEEIAFFSKQLERLDAAEALISC